MIRLTAPKPRARGRGFETAEQAAERARFDLALVAVLSDGGLRRSEAAALTWGDAQRWDDGSGRITVIRSKTDAEAQGAVVAITPAAMRALDAIRPAGVGGAVKVFGLSESQIARRVKAVAKAAGSGGLGIFQRPQRAGGHGPPHGPERRAHPRDRTPGPLETGRRHGRPLHPRRIRRFGVALPITAGSQSHVRSGIINDAQRSAISTAKISLRVVTLAARPPPSQPHAVRQGMRFADWDGIYAVTF